MCYASRSDEEGGQRWVVLPVEEILEGLSPSKLSLIVIVLHQIATYTNA